MNSREGSAHPAPSCTWEANPKPAWCLPCQNRSSLRRPCRMPARMRDQCSHHPNTRPCLPSWRRPLRRAAANNFQKCSTARSKRHLPTVSRQAAGRCTLLARGLQLRRHLLGCQQPPAAYAVYAAGGRCRCQGLRQGQAGVRTKRLRTRRLLERGRMDLGWPDLRPGRHLGYRHVPADRSRWRQAIADSSDPRQTDPMRLRCFT